MENRMNTGAAQPSEQDIRALMESDSAIKLLQYLRQNGGDSLTQAITAAQKGDYTKAYTALKPLLESPNASRLVEAFNRKRG